MSSDGRPSDHVDNGHSLKVIVVWRVQMNNFWLQWWTDPLPVQLQAKFPRLLVALFLGICIGAERQWRQRAAGLRTNTPVCFEPQPLSILALP
jgi:hypothetical protein